MTEGEIKAAASCRKTYVGRRAIMSLVMSRSDSTKQYIAKRLQTYFHKREESAKRLNKLAKTLGVKITRLELK